MLLWPAACRCVARLPPSISQMLTQIRSLWADRSSDWVVFCSSSHSEEVPLTDLGLNHGLIVRTCITRSCRCCALGGTENQDKECPEWSRHYFTRRVNPSYSLLFASLFVNVHYVFRRPPIISFHISSLFGITADLVESVELALCVAVCYNFPSVSCWSRSLCAHSLI